MNSHEAARGSRFKDIPYFNGGLFAEPARLELHDQEFVPLRKAADFNWTKVQPEIFGTLFQHSMEDEERHAFGAHFTHPVAAFNAHPRYIVCPHVTKRPTFAFLSREIRPDMQLMVFDFTDDYSFAVLQSGTHWQWFVAKCSKLTERFRYTGDTVFETFPWRQSLTAKQVQAVAEAGRKIRGVRADALAKIKGGLRALYRALETTGANPHKDAHAVPDTAVLATYDFSAKKDLLAQLLALNQAVAQRIEKSEPVTAPVIPASFPKPQNLISDDSIRPCAN